MFPRRTSAGMWSAMVVALLLLASSWAVAWGQEAIGTGQITVSVVPAGDPLEIAPGESVSVVTGSGQVNAPDAVDRAQVLPGTVSARILVVDVDRSGASLPGTILVVRDDRGTSLGWGVTISVDDGQDRERPWVPVLLVNQPGTIVCLLPADASRTGEADVHVGGTIGPLSGPVVVLRAPVSGGAGVFSQELGIIYPGDALQPLPAIVVDIPVAP